MVRLKAQYRGLCYKFWYNFSIRYSATSVSAYRPTGGLWLTVEITRELKIKVG